MEPKHDVENVVGVALFALGRGAKGLAIDLEAVQLVRDRFTARAQGAVECRHWRKKWDREHPYLLGNAEALGRCAARLADADGRQAITLDDVELAMRKLRGRMPIAGRWCPF